MAVLENLTPHGVLSNPTVTRDGEQAFLVCLAAHYVLPQPETDPSTPLAPCDDQPPPPGGDDQPPPPGGDDYWGDPTESSLKVEGQAACYRPGTDVYVSGQAWAPGKRPTLATRVQVRVGPMHAAAVVMGDRRWRRRMLGGVEISPPEPFVSLPLRWERAYGGTCPSTDEGKEPLWEPRNPVGRGLHPDPAAADLQLLPNLERQDQLIRTFGDRPEPVGFGPIARHWEPRRALGGTYDEHWTEARAPLWPEDFDEHYFCAAPMELRSPEFLRGGEPVQLEGLHPDGKLRFHLPRLGFSLRAVLDGRPVRRSLNLDGVAFSLDEGRLALYYRTTVPAPRGLLELESAWLRQLEPWELT